jgi:formiminotetrahydrofolate cyclodeaminase
MGAALGEMVLRYSQPSNAPDPALGEALERVAAARETLLAGVDDDTHAFETLRHARRARKAAPSDPATNQSYRDAIRRATEVPLATARTAHAASSELESVRSKVRSSIASDLTTALALLGAARAGALANVAINLPDLEAAGLDGQSIRAEARSLGME